MENHQQIFKKFLIDAKVLEKDLPIFIEKAKYHQVKEPKLLINSDQKVDKIFIIVEGDCIYRFFDKAGFLSREHMKIWSPSMTGGYEYVTGSEKYRKEVKLIKGGYYELEIKGLEEACNESLLRLCRTGCKNLMYYVSKAIVKQREKNIRNANAILGTAGVLVSYILFFRNIVDIRSPSTLTFLLAFYLFCMAIALYFFISKYLRYPFRCYGVTWRRWKESIRDGILFSIPMLLFVIAGKTISTFTPGSFFYGQNVFGFYNKEGDMVIWVILIYSLFCYVQEFITRGLLVYLFRQLFLEDEPHKTPWRSIIIPSVLFGLMHIHYSFVFVIFAFILSLYWGLIYVRTNNLIGVTLNHILVSLFGLYVLGFNELLI